MFTLGNLREYYLDLSVVEEFRAFQREAMVVTIVDFVNKLCDHSFSALSDVQQHLIIATLIKHNVLKVDTPADVMNRPIANESPVAFFNLEKEIDETIYEDSDDWK